MRKEIEIGIFRKGTRTLITRYNRSQLCGIDVSKLTVSDHGHRYHATVVVGDKGRNPQAFFANQTVECNEVVLTIFRY